MGKGEGALMPACLVSKTVTCRPPTSAVPIVLPTTQPTSLAKPGSLPTSPSKPLVLTVASCCMRPALFPISVALSASREEPRFGPSS